VVWEDPLRRDPVRSIVEDNLQFLRIFMTSPPAARETQQK
jgi:hypothetical protein